MEKTADIGVEMDVKVEPVTQLMADVTAQLDGLDRCAPDVSELMLLSYDIELLLR